MVDWHKQKINAYIVDCQNRAKEYFDKSVNETASFYKSHLQDIARYWYREARLLNGCEDKVYA